MKIYYINLYKALKTSFLIKKINNNYQSNLFINTNNKIY